MKRVVIGVIILSIILMISCCPHIKTNPSYITPKITMEKAAELAEAYVINELGLKEFKYIDKEVYEDIHSFSAWYVYFHITDQTRPQGMTILVDKVSGKCARAPWR